MQKNQDINQKLILQLEKQLKDKKPSMGQVKKEIEAAAWQKQTEAKERENEELRKVIGGLRKELNELKSENEQGLSEVAFYLTEMKEVKDRILQALLTSKAMITNQDSLADDFSIDPPSDYDCLTLLKQIIRSELEHLIILNSHSLDLQNLLQDKKYGL